jgi:glycosyltransferase involved in cell wall biosynthesis
MTDSPPLRVLVVTNMYPAAARPYFGIFVRRQVEALRRAGVDVELEVVAADRGELDYLGGRRRVAARVRLFRPHLIHCHYGYTPLAAAFAGRPYVVTLCGDDLNGQSNGRGGVTLKSRAGTLVTQLFASSARRVIVKSEAMRRRLWRRSRAKSELLPNGVNTTLFSPGSQREARERLGIPAEARVVLFVNSIQQATKRLDLALAARDELSRRGAPAHLLIAESVPADAMPWHYRAADVLLMTSDREGAPNCVKEALACGVPVVAVPVGDIPELITRPGMGRIVLQDPGALADGILAVGRAGDDRASLLPPELSEERVAERLIDIYQRAVRR